MQIGRQKYLFGIPISPVVLVIIHLQIVQNVHHHFCLPSKREEQNDEKRRVKKVIGYLKSQIRILDRILFGHFVHSTEKVDGREKIQGPLKTLSILDQNTIII